MKMGSVRLARLAPPLTLAILLGPLVFGLAGTALPAFGYLPELGGEHFTTEHFGVLGAQPGIARSALLSILIGLVTTLVSLGNRGGVCRQRSGNGDVLAGAPADFAIAVGAPRRGGFRAGLPDRAVGHDHAADIPMGHRA
jgi:hypothetical protein